MDELTALSTTSVLMHAPNNTNAEKVIKSLDVMLDANKDKKLSLPLSSVLAEELLKGYDSVSGKLKPDFSNVKDPSLNAAMTAYTFKDDGKVTNVVDMTATILPRTGKEPDLEQKREVYRFFKSHFAPGSVDDSAKLSEQQVNDKFGIITGKLFGSADNYQTVLQKLSTHKGDGLCPAGCTIAPALDNVEAKSPLELKNQVGDTKAVKEALGK